MRTPITQLLSSAEEHQLARQIEAGALAGEALAEGWPAITASSEELRTLVAEGEQARQRFLLANLRLVWKLAGQQARRTGIEVSELFQEGCVALAGALHRFDPERGRFSTFATIRIERHLAEVAAGRLGELALPPSRALAVRQARGTAAALAQRWGREASAVEVATELGVSVAQADSLLAHREPIPLDLLSCELAQPEPADFDAGLLAGQVRRLLRRLPGDEARLLMLRYGLGGAEPMLQAEVAAQLGLSIRTARRMECRALATLRRYAKSSDLPLAS